MAWWKKDRKDNSGGIKLPRLPTPAAISSYIKKLLRVNRAEFFEIEPMEVTKTDLDDWSQGAIMGTFINEPSQQIKGGAVLPLFPNSKQIPLIGEHVIVAEYNGQHYYYGIINRKNSVNENSIPGVGGDYQKNTKYGKTFERKNIRPVKLNEGEIVHYGRFGQSIKFGTYPGNNKPTIKIRCGQRSLTNEEKLKSGLPINEDIELDGSSIYLLDDGLPWKTKKPPEVSAEKFDGDIVRGKKILIKSDGVDISGRDDVSINAGKDVYISGEEVFIHARAGSTIKLGPPNALFIPTINAEVLGDLLKNLVDAFGTLSTLVPKLATPPTAAKAAGEIVQLVGQKLPSIIDIIVNKKYLNTQIMVANPNIKLPFPSKKGITRKKKLNDLNPDTQAGGTDTGTGTGRSENGDSTRDSSGNRDVGPRRY